MMIVTIDPGTRKCGYALWHNTPKHPKTFSLQSFGVWGAKGKGKTAWIGRAETITRTLEATLKQLELDFEVIAVVVELPRHVAGRAAARNSGAILKLMYLVGQLLGVSLAATGRAAEVVPVATWKGNVPKEITARRVFRSLGIRSESADAVDAIGIGLYWLRKNGYKFEKNG